MSLEIKRFHDDLHGPAMRNAGPWDTCTAWPCRALAEALKLQAAKGGIGSFHLTEQDLREIIPHNVHPEGVVSPDSDYDWAAIIDLPAIICEARARSQNQEHLPDCKAPIGIWCSC